MDRIGYQDMVWGIEMPKRGNLLSSGTLILEGILKTLENVDGSVLDVGCGGGQFSRAVKYYSPKLQVYGVDVGRDAVDFAKKNSEGITFELGRAEQLPFKDETFDAVFSIEVLEHVNNFERSVKEMHRVLKEGGKLYLSVNCEGSKWTLPGLLSLLNIDYTSETIGHINKLSYKKVTDELKNSGFVIKRIFYFGHLVRQFEDFFYTQLLKRKKLKPGDLWKEYRNGAGEKKVIYIMMKIAVFLTNLESKILSFLPGISIQIRAVKK